jgi:hypothetical protein
MSILHDQFLEVIAVGDEAWRVCDGRVDPADATRVLAFVERRHNRFELLRIGAGPAVCEHFDCLDAALDDLIRRMGAVAMAPAA